MTLTDRSATSPHGQTSFDWMAAHVAADPGRPAYVGAGGARSYRQLHDAALSLAAGLRALGVGKGDVVAAQLPNGLEFILTYLGANYLGAVLQPLHMPYRQAEILPLLQHSRAKVAIGLSHAKDYSPVRLMLALRDELPHLGSVIAVGPDAPDGARQFQELCDTPAEPIARADVAPEDDFLLLYTSGTTAAPKGISVDYARFLSNAALCAEEMGVGKGATLLSAAPATHLYGLLSLNLAIVTGALTATLPSFSPEGLAAALEAHRPTGLFVAPAHIAACASQGLLTEERLSSLDFVMISGSACPPQLARDLQAIMPCGKVCQLWGMSELQVGAFTRPSDPLEVRLSTVGRPSPATELRIAAGDAPFDRTLEGELQVRGLSVFEGYLDNGPANETAFTDDGWFRTGDLARMTATGQVQLTGRLKDVINRGGVKFNPTDVEAMIELHPAVAACAIVAMPDAVLGERACCFVVVNAAATFDIDQMREWLAARHLAKNKWPERLEIIDEMPMTPTRKIKKAELAARLAAIP